MTPRATALSAGSRVMTFSCTSQPSRPAAFAAYRKAKPCNSMWPRVPRAGKRRTFAPHNTAKGRPGGRPFSSFYSSASFVAFEPSQEFLTQIAFHGPSDQAGHEIPWRGGFWIVKYGNAARNCLWLSSNDSNPDRINAACACCSPGARAFEAYSPRQMKPLCACRCRKSMLAHPCDLAYYVVRPPLCFFVHSTDILSNYSEKEHVDTRKKGHCKN